jgi:hypothetical protein
MLYQESKRDDRATLLAFVAALDASPRSLRRDECGDYVIKGKSGHVYVDGNGYLLVVTTGESPRRWTSVKKRLSFCRVAQHGDDEGSLHLDRLPAPHEASLIRDALGIKRKRRLSPEVLASLQNRLSGRTGGPFHGRTSP